MLKTPIATWLRIFNSCTIRRYAREKFYGVEGDYLMYFDSIFLLTGSA